LKSLLSKDGAERVWNEAEVDAASIDVLGKLSQNGRGEEHNIVEWVKAVPECRCDKGGEVVSQARFLSRNKCPIVDVVLEP
jgi:hypothetical protein